jgi:hypothetical protein
MEFVDHREYEAGDDLRHFDPHLYARLGETFIRQYEVHRQLPIAILVDGSRSMVVGEPSRFTAALRLASILGFIGLAGGDQVQIGIASDDRIHWSPRFHGITRAQTLFTWLDAPEARGAILGHALRNAAEHITERGLVIVISDWWDDVASDIATLAASGQEIWGLHLVTPEEVDPSQLGSDEARLVDAETGLEIDLVLDRTTMDRYRRGFVAWCDQLRESLGNVRGQYLQVAVETPLETLFLQTWRRLGLVS